MAMVRVSLAGSGPMEGGKGVLPVQPPPTGPPLPRAVLLPLRAT